MVDVDQEGFYQSGKLEAEFKKPQLQFDKLKSIMYRNFFTVFECSTDFASSDAERSPEVHIYTLGDFKQPVLTLSLNQEESVLDLVTSTEYS